MRVAPVSLMLICHVSEMSLECFVADILLVYRLSLGEHSRQLYNTWEPSSYHTSAHKYGGWLRQLEGMTRKLYHKTFNNRSYTEQI